MRTNMRIIICCKNRTVWKYMIPLKTDYTIHLQLKELFLCRNKFVTVLHKLTSNKQVTSKWGYLTCTSTQIPSTYWSYPLCFLSFLSLYISFFSFSFFLPRLCSSEKKYGIITTQAYTCEWYYERNVGNLLCVRRKVSQWNKY